MAEMVARVLPETLRKPLAARAGLEAKPLRNSVAVTDERQDRRRVYGQLLDRAFAIAGRTKQAVALELGYETQASVSRWVNGEETAHTHALMALDWFPIAYVMAMAERHPEQFEVERNVRIKAGVA